MLNFPALHCTIDSTMTVLDNSMFDYCSNFFLDCCLEQVGTKLLMMHLYCLGSSFRAQMRLHLSSVSR